MVAKLLNKEEQEQWETEHMLHERRSEYREQASYTAPAAKTQDLDEGLSQPGPEALPRGFQVPNLLLLFVGHNLVLVSEEPKVKEMVQTLEAPAAPADRSVGSVQQTETPRGSARSANGSRILLTRFQTHSQPVLAILPINTLCPLACCPPSEMGKNLGRGGTDSLASTDSRLLRDSPTQSRKDSASE
ncbi:hypothetical protein TREES_T100002613 [Tupaia chinensis]|uniref:Uncharacterized protein n=1 Tax=Tupaia chinensis TaxID=246437 RepID=L9L5X0_TUPCH|nr:hypothetical protein TREES_T100002613 [Tupaia chinensis]